MSMREGRGASREVGEFANGFSFSLRETPLPEALLARHDVVSGVRRRMDFFHGQHCRQRGAGRAGADELPDIEGLVFRGALDAIDFPDHADGFSSPRGGRAREIPRLSQDDRGVHHILLNYLNQMQFVTMEARSARTSTRRRRGLRARSPTRPRGTPEARPAGKNHRGGNRRHRVSPDAKAK